MPENKLTNTFKYEKSTAGTHRFSRQQENGRKETQYISKADMPQAADEITVTITW